MSLPIRTYVLRNVGYDAQDRETEAVSIRAASWPEAVSAVLGKRIGFTEPIAPRSSIHACYERVGPAGHNKVGCVQHLKTHDDDTDLPVGFVKRLAMLREAAALTLADLGDAAGLSRQRVHQLEAGTHRPRWGEVQALAAALGVSTDTFRDPE